MDPVKSTCVTLNKVYENITDIVEELEISRPLLISNRAMIYIHFYLNIMLAGNMAVFGTVNNIFNMIIFHKLGMKDSMSTGLMALSVTDFLVSFFSVVKIAFLVWDLLAPNVNINPFGVHYVTFGWWRDILFLCSAWITTLLSIERCACVVFPFKVKDMFTKARTIAVVIIIFIVNIAAHIPVFASQWLEWETLEGEISNGTAPMEWLAVKFSDNRRQIQIYIDIVNGAVLPMPSQALVLISGIWMIYGLKTSSKIRRTPNATSGTVEVHNMKRDNLSKKEKRLVKMVLFLALILTTCNIPRFIAVYAKQLFPEVDYGNSNTNLYRLLWHITFLANSMNSSVNIFVYLTVNASYRHKLKTLLCRKVYYSRA